MSTIVHVKALKTICVTIAIDISEFDLDADGLTRDELVSRVVDVAYDAGDAGAGEEVARDCAEYRADAICDSDVDRVVDDIMATREDLAEDVA